MSNEQNELGETKIQLPSDRKASEGIEDFPQQAVQIPRLVIGQPNNLSGYEEGKFINNLTGETYEKLDVVLLKFKRSRNLWPAGKPSKGDEPTCKASDAKNADIEFLGKLCPRCNKEHTKCVDADEHPFCEHAKFKEDFKPECRLTYHFLLVTIPEGDIFTTAFTGKGISPTNRLLSNFKIKGRALYSAKLTLNLDKAPDGNFYTIRYSNFKWLENPEELKSLFDNFKDIQVVPAQEETHAEASPES